MLIIKRDSVYGWAQLSDKSCISVVEVDRTKQRKSFNISEICFKKSKAQKLAFTFGIDNLLKHLLFFSENHYQSIFMILHLATIIS